MVGTCVAFWALVLCLGCNSPTLEKSNLMQVAEKENFRYLHLYMVPFSGSGHYSHVIDLTTGESSYSYEDKEKYSGSLNETVIEEIRSILRAAKFETKTVEPSGRAIDGDFPGLSLNHDRDKFWVADEKRFFGLPDGSATQIDIFEDRTFMQRLIEILKNENPNPASKK